MIFAWADFVNVHHDGSYHFSHCDVESKKRTIRGVKYWEIIADNLHKAGWSLGLVSGIDPEGRTIWIVDGPTLTHAGYDVVAGPLSAEQLLARMNQ